MSEININGFTGANNIKTEERFFVKKGIVEPKLILNANVDMTGGLTTRTGKILRSSLSGAHSLWAGNLCRLCVANGVLYRLWDNTATNVGAVSGPKYPMSYVDAEDKVYMSNPYWRGIFDPSTNTLSFWGTPQPPGPMLLSGDGNLPAGSYHVCMTNVSEGELSGNGPISDITLASTGGIQILNRPAGALAWATDANESIFYLVGAISKIVDLPSIEPLPSFLCSPPPYLENLCYAFGRIWGSSGTEVYYSQPFNLGWFKLASNKYSFEDTVTMIAKVSTGLFIGMKHRTRFLGGTIPEQMVQSDAGTGSVKGTLTYCNSMPYLADVLGTAEKVISDVPVWLSEEGIVAGNTVGRLFNLTKDNLKISAPNEGAGLYRDLNGIIQILMSFKQGGLGASDTETIAAMKKGEIVTSAHSFMGSNSTAGFTDSVDVTHTRGGVILP